MIEEDVIKALDEMDENDPDRAHSQADGLLLQLVHPEVRAAYERLVDRSHWWSCA